VACHASRNLHGPVTDAQCNPAKVASDMRSIVSPVISMDRVAKNSRSKRALDHVSATIHPGQFVANKVPHGVLRVIWVSKLIPNDPVVVRKDLPASLKSAIQESLVSMKSRSPEAFKEIGAWVGNFVPADDSRYQVMRELNETARRLKAAK
jgi:ABC-type phosphate/phosphonate transport system substrate-binding protein